MCQRKAGTKCSALQGASIVEEKSLPALLSPRAAFGSLSGALPAPGQTVQWFWRHDFLALTWSGPLCPFWSGFLDRKPHNLCLSSKTTEPVQRLFLEPVVLQLLWGWIKEGKCSSGFLQGTSLKLDVPHILKCLVSLSCLLSEKRLLKRKYLLTRWSARLISYPLSSNSSGVNSWA